VGSEARLRYSAFGLELLSSIEIPQLSGISDTRDSRPTAIRELAPDEAGRWRYPHGDVIVDRRLPDGRLMLGIDHAAGVGYRIWSTGYGRFVVSDDALDVRAAVSRTPSAKWQRLLFAQVLPLTAALRGTLLLHASAVELGGRAYAFSAASGTGKTSTALHLVGAGATLITDDVLAVTVSDTVVAHPGAPVVAVKREDLSGLDRDERGHVGAVEAAIDGKAQVRVAPAREPLPLAAVYFLDRQLYTRTIEIDKCTPDPRVLLASAFITYLGTPEYLIAMLESCARVAREVPLFTVRVPGASGAAAVSRELAEHIRTVDAARAA